MKKVLIAAAIGFVLYKLFSGGHGEPTHNDIGGKTVKPDSSGKRKINPALNKAK